MAPVVVVERRGARVGWAVVAANGRLLARSAATYRTGTELALAFRDLLADRRSLRIAVARDEGALTWSWTASLPARDGAVRAVARSGRGYLRQDQCRTGAAGFVEVLEVLPASAPGEMPGRPADRGRPERQEGRHPDPDNPLMPPLR